MGRLVHRLLELVPALPEELREAAILRHLAREAPDVDAAALARRLQGLIADPRLAPLFGPDALAEQAIVGVLDGVPMLGQIDRLAVTPTAVLAIDFKTGRAPEPGEEVPVAYRRQMAAYRRLLALRWPDRPVRTALVWTATQDVTWLEPGPA
jgi:ATP-dependent helicase/nuclease subunit A